MSELIDRQAVLDALSNAVPTLTTPDGGGQFDRELQIVGEALVDAMQIVHALPTASPWHRVEEKPKKHGKYPVCWVENGNFYWQEAHYCYYQDGDKWVAWSSYQGDDVEITPDYWMPIEPPKEDA